MSLLPLVDVGSYVILYRFKNRDIYFGNGKTYLANCMSKYHKLFIQKKKLEKLSRCFDRDIKFDKATNTHIRGAAICAKV